MPTLFQKISAILFLLALLHTFSAKFFDRLARKHSTHTGLYHLLGEVEVIFGFWGMVLVSVMFAMRGEEATITYVNSCRFAEPMFVFAVMVVAGTKPILSFILKAIMQLAEWLPFSKEKMLYFMTLSILPLLGSLVTEPAAMTLSALILNDYFFSKGQSRYFKYATLATLLVNISVGGVLTTYAAPPIIMVAEKWDWDSYFMFSTFGWKAITVVFLNGAVASLFFWKKLGKSLASELDSPGERIPWTITLTHLTFLLALVRFSHHPALFMGIFFLFLGMSEAYKQYHSRLFLREGLLVAFFLSGLVVLGGQQQWWLQPLLARMKQEIVFFTAMALTAFTDNAALTYLGSLVEGVSDSFKYALVSGAIVGGGLTLIANAPNLVGASLLKNHFEEKGISPWILFLAALFPTMIAFLIFRFF